MKDHASAFLKALVHKYLLANLLDSARFYAERLYYEAPCAESLHLLALCYYRSGKTKQAYLVLQDYMHNPMIASSANKFLFALTCNDLDKLEEGEQALRQQYTILSSDKITLESVKDTPGGAEGVYLLGKLCRRQHRKDMAITYYRLCLRMDPYLWSAMTELSEMGVAINVKELFNGPAQGASRSVFEEGNTTEERPFQPLHSLEEKAGWISEIKHTNQERYYSANNVFSDSKSGTMERLQQFSAAEHLSSGVQDGAGRQASPGVSMSLGLSSMSLHVPFVSPSSMPSPPMSVNSALPAGPYAGPYTSMHTAGIAAEDSGYSGEALDLTMTMNMTDSGDSALFSARRTRSDSYGDNESEGPTSGPYKAGLKDAKAALFGMGTPGLTPISASVPTDTPGLNLDTDAHSNINTGVSTGNIMNRAVGVDLFGSSAPNSTVNSAAPPHGLSGGAPRRVSFGPTARLSFSGALGGDAMSAQQAHIAQLRQAQTGGTATSTGTTDGADQEDGYPYKLPRTDEEGGTSPASGTHRSAEDSNRQLPHKIIMSPFPVESSPIPLAAGGAGATGGDTFPSPTFRRRYGTRGSSASSSVAQKAVEVDNKENAQGAEELPSSPGNRIPPTHPLAQPHVTLSIHASAHYEHLHYVSVPRCPQVDQLVITLARAYQMLCLYFCRACIDELQTLPERHFRSALVSQWIGKAYYEMNQYKPAMLAFREMLRAEPFRLCGLETLSTALWHLKRDKELCTLAQQVVEVDKMAPECWCVVGNCFSLQREPDTAIKFFQRALQMDPSFTYAYTLCGHEQVSNLYIFVCVC